MNQKTALITGITGQDGSYLAEFLIDKGYDVHGLLRRSSSFNTARIEHLYLDEWVRDMKRKRLVNLHWADMTDSSSLIRIIGEVKPTEIYNLAAQSHVKVSFDVPEYTADTDAVGVLRLLEAVRICGLEKQCRIYQASTSELYGKVQEVPQKETTPFYPRSPYAVAKLYGYWIMKNYRESYGMYCCNGILFNHESEGQDAPAQGAQDHARGRRTHRPLQRAAGHLGAAELGRVSLARALARVLHRERGHGRHSHAHREGRDLRQVQPHVVAHLHQRFLHRVRHDGRQLHSPQAHKTRSQEVLPARCGPCHDRRVALALHPSLTCFHTGMDASGRGARSIAWWPTTKKGQVCCSPVGETGSTLAL